MLKIDSPTRTEQQILFKQIRNQFRKQSENSEEKIGENKSLDLVLLTLQAIVFPIASGKNTINIFIDIIVQGIFVCSEDHQNYHFIC